VTTFLDRLYSSGRADAAPLRLYGVIGLLMLLPLAAPACAQSPDASETACDDPFAEAGPLRFDPSAWDTNFCRHSVPYGEIRSGGPPRDGIPSLDDPKHVATEQADAWLAPNEPVIRLKRDGEARAYPLQILVWHEVANDRLGGVPVVVTFCPLCYTLNAEGVTVRRSREHGAKPQLPAKGEHHVHVAQIGSL
jgi:hypothetical protein